jgi:hypothetical protein
MDQVQKSSSSQAISLFRERFSDQYVFYRLDDADRSQTCGVRETTLFDFVKQFQAVGGLSFFYSEVIVKGMAAPEEYVEDIRDENGAVIWVNSSPAQSS